MRCPTAASGSSSQARGARTYMVDVDASGRIVEAVQVLNEDNFRNIGPA